VGNLFSGTTEMWIVDATLKWTPSGDPKRRYLKLQGEYMQRTQDGNLAYVDALGQLDGSYDTDQHGWYVQGVYQFLPRWRFGARYDSLDSGDTRIGLVRDGTLAADDFSVLLPATPTRTTVMFDWSPSEFSRLRAQYAWDEASAGPTDEQFFLQYIYALGAHGAHKF
jgi:outer membrane receptor protein involved in Fe transport